MSAGVVFGDRLENGGLLVGNNPGTVNIYREASRECWDRSRLQLEIRKSSIVLTPSIVAESAVHQPEPISTVPFRRDHDFVDRGKLLEKLHQKLAPETTWAALIGLGGIGYAI